MQKGAGIGEVFKRLADACSIIEKVAKFSHDDHLGYITSCPTNLGTALRASVHIRLPNLGADKAKFQQVADEFKVQIRGIHGEHSETADHVYDISNKRRLGISEVKLVQDMIDGITAMINWELSLKSKLERESKQKSEEAEQAKKKAEEEEQAKKKAEEEQKKKEIAEAAEKAKAEEGIALKKKEKEIAEAAAKAEEDSKPKAEFLP